MVNALLHQVCAEYPDCMTADPVSQTVGRQRGLPSQCTALNNLRRYGTLLSCISDTGPEVQPKVQVGVFVPRLWSSGVIRECAWSEHFLIVTPASSALHIDNHLDSIRPDPLEHEVLRPVHGSRLREPKVPL